MPTVDRMTPPSPKQNNKMPIQLEAKKLITSAGLPIFHSINGQRAKTIRTVLIKGIHSEKYTALVITRQSSPFKIEATSPKRSFVGIKNVFVKVENSK